MNAEIKNLQDNALLYELSLAVGSSLDSFENCDAFLRTLVRLKNLDFASVWLVNEAGEYELFYSTPFERAEVRRLPAGHLILEKLAWQPYLLIDSTDENFAKLKHEKGVGEGTYGIFGLGKIGFLKIYAQSAVPHHQSPVTNPQLAQLRSVVQKFAISLAGCEAHRRLMEETEQRKLMEKALKEVNRRVRENETKLRQVIDYSLDALVTIDGEGRVTQWSKQAEKMFGILREEAIGEMVEELIIPPARRQVYKKAIAVFRDADHDEVLNKRIEIAAVRKSGQVFPIELSISILQNEDGRFCSFFIRDIQERHTAEVALKNAQIRLTNLVTNLQAGVLLENENREIVLANRYFCEVFNIPSEPAWLVGKDCSESAENSKHLFLEPQSFVRGVDELLAQKERVVGQLLTMADGRILERDFIPLFSEEKYLGHLWQYRDVTERHLTQLAIQKSEEKYRGIIENMELGLLEVDKNHKIMRPYRAFCEMVGYTEEELLGQNALELFLPENYRSLMAEQDAQRAEGQAGVYEVQMKKKDGSLIWALISGAPIRDGEGQVVGSIGIHYDLTARKKLELDLASAKRVAEQARLAERQFLANMSHEIRTPMNAVIGMAHLLCETELTAKQKDFLNSLRFSADSLMAIINDVLDISKIEAGELEFEEKAFDLAHLLRSVQRTIQFKVREKPISVTLEVDAGIENLVVGDPTRLNQVLTNLLGNASKFTKKGTIGIQVKLLENTVENHLFEFRIHDTGIGIPAENLDDIFQNFKQADVKVTRKFGGTGLGLTIVKQLVERQGGHIRVESKVGRGSTFVFSLPLKNSGRPLSEKPLKKEEFGPSHHRAFLEKLDILIVEDNLMNQKLITQILGMWGCTFKLANNGLEALLLSRTKVFDLILMDVHMPEMDGVEATKKIRSDEENINQKTPIVALTAAALLEEKKRALESGMNDFLTKPFSPRMLEKCIVNLLGENENVEEKESAQLSENIPSPELKIDLKYLFEFSNGDRHFVIDMVETYLRETPPALEILATELSKGKWDEVYKIVHKLKPNFMMLGMEEQRTKAAEVEALIKSGNMSEEKTMGMVEELMAAARESFGVLEERLELV